MEAHLPPGAPWVTLDLDDGTTVSAMGIQGSDGARAQTALRELRAVLKPPRRGSPVRFRGQRPPKPGMHGTTPPRSGEGADAPGGGELVGVLAGGGEDDQVAAGAEGVGG